MSLMLNSFPNEQLKVADDGQKAGNISRSDLVATGRLLALEYNGRATNAIHKQEEYSPGWTISAMPICPPDTGRSC